MSDDHACASTTSSVPRGGRPGAARRVASRCRPARSPRCSGPNGAGKSTLVLDDRRRAAADRRHDPPRRSRPDQGASPSKIRAAGVAVVPEGRRLLPNLTVVDNLQGRHLHRCRRDEAAAGVDYALELFPELRAAARHHGSVAVGRRAADGGAGPGAGRHAQGDARRRAVARARPGRRQAPDAGARSASPRAASACC